MADTHVPVEDTPTDVPPHAGAQGLRGALARGTQETGFWIFVVLVLLIIVFSVVAPGGTYLTTFNLQTLLSDSSQLLILACAALLVIVSGGIDLSVGSLMSLGAALGFLTIDAFGKDPGTLPILLGVLVGVGSAGLWGAMNGFLITRLKVPPFVVTLGSLGAALGVARLLLQGGSFASTAPEGLQNVLGIGLIAGIPAPFVIAAVLAIVIGLLLAKTRFGEHIYLTGANPEGARRAGISVRRTQVLVYTTSGLLAGIAGMMDFARFNSVDISTGHTSALIGSIAAVIIGGASLLGGVGTMIGTVVAVFIPVVLTNGLIISGAPSFWQEIVIGVILVAAVGFDQWRRDAAGRPPRSAARRRA
jgi:ribose transport system permease protein